MNSAILCAASRVLMPLLLLFAVFLFLRGHNEPGGGFVAGLVISIAFVLLMFSDGVAAARRAMLVDPSRLLGIGLLVSLASGVAGGLFGDVFLKALWTEFDISRVHVVLGSPLVFDLGVCLVVIGVVLTMTFTLAED